VCGGVEENIVSESLGCRLSQLLLHIRMLRDILM
jgi:hypothetical protein